MAKPKITPEVVALAESIDAAAKRCAVQVTAAHDSHALLSELQSEVLREIIKDELHNRTRALLGLE